MNGPNLPIERRRQGRGFTYLKDGKTIRNPRERSRISKLAIPPAWEQVRIAPAGARKILARGVDAAGRTQTIYHPAYRRRQEAQKYDRVLRFAQQLPALRAQVAKDLRRRRLSQRKVVAAIVHLLDTEFFRIGNERYAREHRSFGLTTLRKRHIRANSQTVVFDFIGKSGKRQKRKVKDRQLAHLINQLANLPGPELFSYIDTSGQAHSVTSAHVNNYIKAHMGEEFTAKDFRTWGGTLLATSLLLAAEGDGSAQKARSAVVNHVAQRLGNTPAVTKASYIDPRVLALVADEVGLAAIRVAMSRMRPRKYLSVDEQCVLKILQEAATD